MSYTTQSTTVQTSFTFDLCESLTFYVAVSVLLTFIATSAFEFVVFLCRMKVQIFVAFATIVLHNVFRSGWRSPRKHNEKAEERVLE
jgi:hypothetical protein